MSNRIELTQGWIVLRDPATVSERRRRPLLLMSVKGVEALGDLAEDGTVSEQSFTPEQLEFFSEWNDALAIALLEEWSFDGEISLDSLLDLPGGIYDEIRNAVAPYVGQLMPSFGPSTDPKALTETSNA